MEEIQKKVKKSSQSSLESENEISNAKSEEKN